MSLAAGTRLGSFEVTCSIGAGGMGEVYRARDTKLKRDVALKVLPNAVAADVDRLARFQREAEVLAALNHPHIAQVYGVEDGTDAAGAATRALVMELVEGEDLSQRIARGPLPVEEALTIARQIADALEAAHEQGIIHRDLKPANIKVRQDGTVKVLDFGLAKALDQAPRTSSPQDLVNSPTITSPALTQAGIILGTAAYMSPEQAKGRPATRRSDIWAFGCVLYEMLTGRRVFEGEDISDTLANVLRGDPDWSRLPASTPRPVHRLLRRAMARDPRARLADIADARLELGAAGEPPAQSDLIRVPPRVAWRERALWAAALAIATAAAMVLARSTARPGTLGPEMRLDIATPPSVVAPDPSISISPDGRQVAFIADDNRRSMLWVRALDSGSARPFPGTDGARAPFWSSDSRAVGFFTPTQLKTVDVESGSVVALASVVGSGGGTWSGSTIIYSANSGTGPLYRVSTTGGTPEPATRLQSPTALVHRHPWFLPDGQHFLYFEVNPTRSQVFVGSLQEGDAIPLVAADTGAVFSGSGHLLFVRQSALLAQAFDPSRLALGGAAQPLAEQIAVNEIGRPAVSASASGSIAYRTGVDVARRQFVWFDRSGKEVSRVATPEISQSNPEISPDGARLALQRNVSGNTDIWLLDVQRGIFNRVTNDAAIDALPIWSPDGRRLAFTSNRGLSASRDSMATPTGLQRGIGSLLVMSADGSGEPQVLVTSPEPKWANDWSRDGRQLVFRSLEQPGTHDVWVTAVEHPAPVKILDSPADERDAQLSPDGRWIAYQSNESSRDEVYIQRFPERGGKERVSTAGGTQVRWRADGRELFYVTPANEIAAVSIQLPPGEGQPRIGSPQVLFATRMASGGVGVPRQQYVVSSDGQRFLINALEAVELTTPIRLLLNWTGAGRQENGR